MEFSKADIEQMKERGISPEKVENQLQIFKRGNIPVAIIAAATLGKGIQELPEEKLQEYISEYDSRKEKLEVLKFVPASGAATRMFKALHRFLEEYDPSKTSLEEYLSQDKNTVLKPFFENLQNLPFYHEAENFARKNQAGYDNYSQDARNALVVKAILNLEGLNLSNFPKGLVHFHKYAEFVATAFEEHLYEAAQYLAVNGKAKIHFTVSKNHLEKFKAEFAKIKGRVEKKTGVKFNISYSFQNSETDTIAANNNNEVFRTKEGKLFFRPGGHGALIENLNHQDADLVFIKNIDNVVVKRNLKEVVFYKKALAGKLLEVQDRCFAFMKELDSINIQESKLAEIQSFLKEELYLGLPEKNRSSAEKIQFLKSYLNRPLRACGMVKNEGEPGGGPFLVKMNDGSNSLQIIEGAQINQHDEEQKALAQNATHFNPVDIVCGLKNYKGQKYNLANYVDLDTSFIASKTREGRELKALELPGLWNGAMAKWNTIFVEVPVSTFNPVKTVADLLKTTHQPN